MTPDRAQRIREPILDGIVVKHGKCGCGHSSCCSCVKVLEDQLLDALQALEDARHTTADAAHRSGV